ncbi:MAG TPA: sugar phosphate isomerase/epimerase [Puia sp.]|nr:sugar phosphate isomerase/epimerase [Puia sp.]
MLSQFSTLPAFSKLLAKGSLFFFCCPLLPGSLFAQKAHESSPADPGVVSYTYRKYFEKDIPSTLDLIKGNGITDIEFSNLFGKSAVELRKLIDEKGIYCSSFGVSYDDLVNKTAEVAQNAKALGASYVRVAGIPHKTPQASGSQTEGRFTLEEAQKAIEDFNRVGKILKEEYGLGFIYHNHGFEFQPYLDGTLYDLIVTKTDPKYVSFEMDILWAFFPGQDPAGLLRKYGTRYKALHMKDLRKGVKGNYSGGTSAENDVALGTGQIDLPAVLKAAQAAGIRHYYIEDESNAVMTQVPQSIAYLKSFK